MNPNRDHDLAAWADRQLKSLPELAAPSSLAPRILAAVEAKAQPAPSRGWQSWPLALRLASLAGLVALFAGLYFGGWHVSQSPAVTQATQEAQGVLGLLKTLAEAAGVVIAALIRLVKQLGPIWLAVIAGVLVAGWIACLGLTTAFARLAWSRR